MRYTVTQYITRRRFVGVVATSATVSVAGCSGGGGQKKIDIGDIEYVHENEGTPNETMAVTGVAENVIGGRLNDVSIVVEFTNSRGTVLGESETSRSTLEAGETWEFRVEFPEKGEKAAEVSSTSVKAVV
ncbi:MAG: FxLYD domain-containing protein [Halobacteria archaeon]|nr:FxLYD domain-containing protein [Halobacteria archaeon]